MCTTELFCCAAEMNTLLRTIFETKIFKGKKLKKKKRDLSKGLYVASKDLLEFL